MSTLALVQGTWDVTTNGWSGQLNISSLDGQGNLAGTLTITTTDQGSPTGETGTPVRGYWNGGAQEIWFRRDQSPQTYTGYGYSRLGRPDSVQTLAGFFEDIGTADRHRFGWVASRPIPG